MFNAIYQLSLEPIPSDEYVSESDFWDAWFLGRVAEYVDGDVDRNKEMVKRGGDYIPPQVQDSDKNVVSSANGVMEALDNASKKSNTEAIPQGPNVPPQSEVQKQMNEKK